MASVAVHTGDHRSLAREICRDDIYFQGLKVEGTPVVSSCTRPMLKKKIPVLMCSTGAESPSSGLLVGQIAALSIPSSSQRVPDQSNLCLGAVYWDL